MTDFITWTANPILFDHGVTIRWYGLMFIIGFFLGYKIMERIFRHEGAPEKWLGTLLIYVAISTIVGARLGHVFFYAWDYYSQHPIEILYTWEGGLASHGGTIGIMIAIILFSIFVTKKSPLWTFDRLVIPIALVGALIRIHPRNIWPSHRPSLGIPLHCQHEPMARRCTAHIHSPISPDTTLRSRLLPRTVRPADVDVLETQRRKTPGAPVRSVFHSPVYKPLPYRIRQKPTGSIRSRDDTQHGPIALPAIHCHRNRTCVLRLQPSSRSSQLPQ